MLLTFKKRAIAAFSDLVKHGPGRVELRTTLRIEKVDRKARKIFGWASTSVDPRGVLVIDHDEDVIRPHELEKGAHNFALESRAMGEMHDNIGPGRLIESVFVDAQKRLAMDLEGDDRVAWWVGFKVDDDLVWKRVESGELLELSIGGTAKRIPSTEFPGAFELQDLAIEEVSLVDKGAGVGVRVQMFKRAAPASEDGVKLRDLLDALKKSDNATVTKAIDAAEKAGDVSITKVLTGERAGPVGEKLVDLAKMGEGISLDDIKAKLTVGEWEVLLDALAQAGAPAEEPPPDGGSEPPAEEVEAMEDGEEMPPKMEEDPEMATTKAKKAYEEELRKRDERIAKLEYETRLAKFEKRAAEYEYASGTYESIAKELMKAADLRAQGDEELAKSIEDRIKREHELAKESALLKGIGSPRAGKGGEGDPVALIKAQARELRKGAGAPKSGVALLKACRENQDLYDEYYADRKERQARTR